MGDPAPPAAESGRRIWPEALLAAALAVAALFATAPHIGLTWDEPAYIRAAEVYQAWFAELAADPAAALSEESVRIHWRFNAEHPPLDKVWSGFVWQALRGVTDDLTAHRGGNILLTGLLVAVLYLWLARTHGRTSAWIAVGALLTMPRFFFHAHLAALDVPATAAMVAVAYFFWSTSARPGWGSTIGFGLALGAALAFKSSALLLAPVLLAWTLLCRPRLSLLLRLGLGAGLAVGVFILLWPWLYHATLDRLLGHLRFLTTEHWAIPQWYLGRLHEQPPWHFPIVITLAVVPLTILVAAAWGGVRVVMGARAGSAGWLMLLGAAAPIALLALGANRVYDNERLLMPAFPFIAALAGIGMGWISARIGGAHSGGRRRVLRRAAGCSLVAILFLPQVFSGAALYPHLLSYYSLAVGGVRGAARLGLETTYWCDTYAAAVPFLNAQAPPRSRIWVQDYSADVLIYYQREARLRRDLQIIWPRDGLSVFVGRGAPTRPTELAQADYVLWQYRQSGLTPELARWLSERQPIHAVRRCGLSLMEIYRAGAAPSGP